MRGFAGFPLLWLASLSSPLFTHDSQDVRPVHRPDDNLNLRLDGLGSLRAVRHNVKGAGALAVQAHVLGKRLAHNGLVALADKVAQRIGVLVAVAARKALVRGGGLDEQPRRRKGAKRKKGRKK